MRPTAAIFSTVSGRHWQHSRNLSTSVMDSLSRALDYIQKIIWIVVCLLFIVTNANEVDFTGIFLSEFISKKNWGLSDLYCKLTRKQSSIVSFLTSDSSHQELSSSIWSLVLGNVQYKPLQFLVSCCIFKSSYIQNFNCKLKLNCKQKT